MFTRLLLVQRYLQQRKTRRLALGHSICFFIHRTNMLDEKGYRPSKQPGQANQASMQLQQ